ncbi:MAG: RNA-binding protein [Pseudomonadota bacterium]
MPSRTTARSRSAKRISKLWTLIWRRFQTLGRRKIPNNPNDRPAGSQRLGGKPAAPERECAVTRQIRPQAEMIRFARAPHGEVVPDIAGKLPGRGVWVSADLATLEQAILKDAFSRRFKAKSCAREDLPRAVEALLVQRCISLFGLAKKAGVLVTGFDQVRASLRKAKPAWLIEASDGAVDGRGKVYSLAKALYGDVKVAGALTSAELGMALGREGVIHALLQPGPMVNSWAIAYGRLKGFRLSPEDHWSSAGDP